MKNKHRNTESQKHGKPVGKYIVSVLQCFCVSVFAFSCSTPQNSRVVTVAVLSSPNSLDPRIGSDETSQRIHTLIYDYLLALEKVRVEDLIGAPVIDAFGHVAAIVTGPDAGGAREGMARRVRAFGMDALQTAAGLPTK